VSSSAWEELKRRAGIVRGMQQQGGMTGSFGFPDKKLCIYLTAGVFFD
jgi:hypothetical protein